MSDEDEKKTVQGIAGFLTDAKIGVAFDWKGPQEDPILKIAFEGADNGMRFRMYLSQQDWLRFCFFGTIMLEAWRDGTVLTPATLQEKLSEGEVELSGNALVTKPKKDLN